MAAAKKSGGTGSGSKKTVKTVSTTAVRNSPIPRSSAASSLGETETTATTTATTRASAPRTPTQHQQITQEQIAKRAYEIWRSGKGGSAFENWIRAERELRAQAQNGN